jgi:hypothetical protein
METLSVARCQTVTLYADFPKAHNVAKQVHCLGGERVPGEAGALIGARRPRRQCHADGGDDSESLTL